MRTPQAGLTEVDEVAHDGRGPLLLCMLNLWGSKRGGRRTKESSQRNVEDVGGLMFDMCMPAVSETS